MKTLRYVTVAVLVWGVLSGDGRADEKREEKPRIKGVELSSWRDEEGGWTFVLLNGTNRAKTEKEVKESGTTFKDIDELTSALARLAVGEQVFWVHSLAGFDVPPEPTRTSVGKAAKDAQVDLHVVP